MISHHLAFRVKVCLKEMEKGQKDSLDLDQTTDFYKDFYIINYTLRHLRQRYNSLKVLTLVLIQCHFVRTVPSGVVTVKLFIHLHSAELLPLACFFQNKTCLCSCKFLRKQLTVGRNKVNRARARKEVESVQGMQNLVGGDQRQGRGLA